MAISYEKKIDRLHGRVEGMRSVLILTHDYPDPDCLAAAMGVSHLLNRWNIASTITFGGFVGRAENRAMIRHLNIGVIPFILTELHDYQGIIVVDSFPGSGNLPDIDTEKIIAVLDHHIPVPRGRYRFFMDIRKDIGATSTLVTNYLRAAGCPITHPLATALFYGIKTDTGELGRDACAEDTECYRFLFDTVDHSLLARIEHPDRDQEFFKVLHTATESALLYGPLCHVHLGSVTSPDNIAEMADLFHSLNRVEWMISSGIFKKRVYFSIRSKNEKNAGRKAEKLARSLGGSGGGHRKIGAGSIPVAIQENGPVMEDFVQSFRRVFRIHNEGKSIL